MADNSGLRICIIGSGAMGGLYGGALKEAGEDVILYDIDADVIGAIKENGLAIRGASGDRTIDIPATLDVDEIGPVDIAFVQCEIMSTEAAAKTAKKILKDDGFAITLQNGIGNAEKLQAELGEDRVLAGVCYHSAAQDGPGKVFHTYSARTWIGEMDGRDTQRLQMLSAAMERANLNPEPTDNVIGVLWGKLIHNCALNPICAVSGLRMGEMARHPDADEMQTKIIEEGIAVAKAKGITLHPEPDPMAYLKPYCRIKYTQPSMLQHVEAGRPIEIDAINGALVHEARAIGLEVPYNHAITMMAKARASHAIREHENPNPDWTALEQKARAENPVPKT